jgi:formamidopyrimidine-DNA glycosylase
MPEGPEVFFLAYHLREKLGIHCQSYGKHLFIQTPDNSDNSSREIRDISFGLYGRVFFDNISKKVIKVKAGPISGDDKLISNDEYNLLLLGKKLGPDFMQMTREEMEKFVFEKVGNSRRQLAAVLLDQEEIAGLGVAWISEIAHLSNFTEIELSAKGKDLDELKKFKLVDAMFQIQTIIKNFLFDLIKDLDSVSFVNEWYENLYKIREPFIKAYRKGRPVLIGSRQFWIL